MTDKLISQQSNQFEHRDFGLERTQQFFCSHHDRYVKTKQVIRKSGLTLIEALIAMVLTGLILAGVYNLFGSQENTQVLVDQIAEMNQNLRIAGNAIIMDMRNAGNQVRSSGGIQHVASCGVTDPDFVAGVPAVLVIDGETGQPDTVTVLYAVPGFETRIPEGFEYSSPGSMLPVENPCPGGAVIRGCEQSSPTCFCRGDFIILSDGERSSIFQVTGNAGVGDTLLQIGSSPYNQQQGHQNTGFQGYGGDTRIIKAILRTYWIDRSENPPVLRFAEGVRDNFVNQGILVEGIEDLQINPQGSNERSYEVALTARTRRPVPGSGYRRRTIVETVRVRNIE